MNFRKLTLPVVVVMAALCIQAGCRVKYSLSGASIHSDAKTVSIAHFPNNAAMVSPTLSATFTDAMKDRFANRTRLSEVPENGDLSFEGEITNYVDTPAMISGDDDKATSNRLTITVRVTFANRLEPQYNFNRSFSAYSDYPVSQTLMEAESSLIPEIVEILVNDIFNAAVSNW
ncbi:LPS assembly lipoprotein LptE [Alistipes sp. OttesenSCG-928-B03]|nr:LPS assembly lipoprotein LptE [Alistipes sp. OttesenSCG-928-B03]